MPRWDETHARLRVAALELFTERGYDATGTADVARRAGVSEMTLFRHFPTKESLLLDDPYDPLIASSVRDRPRREPPMRAAVEGVRSAWAELDAETVAGLRTQLQVVVAASNLRGALERNSEATARAVAEALAERGAATVAARAVAAAVVAGLSTALLHWANTEGADLASTVGDALDALGGRA